MTMTQLLSRLLIAVALIFAAGGARGTLAQGAISNPNPSPASVAYAKELLAMKGSPQMFDRMVTGVIENAKNTYLPTHPQLAKPIDEVTAQLTKEYEGKKTEVSTLVASAYARHFTEAELKELLAFYKTNLGKRVLEQEADAVEDGFKRLQEWSGTFSEQVMSKFRAEMKSKGYDL